MFWLLLVIITNFSWGVATYIWLATHSILFIIGISALNFIAGIFEAILFRRDTIRNKVLGLSVARNIFFGAAFLGLNVVFEPGFSLWLLVIIFIVLWMKMKNYLPIKELLFFVLPAISLGSYLILSCLVPTESDKFVPKFFDVKKNVRAIGKLNRYYSIVEVSREDNGRVMKFVGDPSFKAENLRVMHNIWGGTFYYIDEK